ncbi:MAG: hypothetical protein DRJ55_00325 [Thermoprotei archaeon]|mgnify:CR=1 FL=1|nr:MAG: hypothetical protein DRJ55_00325 [Thermoprotei archaeon]
MSSTVQLQEGLTSRTLLAMLFSSLVMMPALLWVYLATGQLVGTIAAAYATMLIFGELGLIMMSPLSASELATIRWGASIAAGYTGGFLFTVYLRKSPITKQFGIAQNIPWWSCPPENSPAMIHRMIWHPDWLLPIGIGLLSMTLVLAADISLSFVARTLFIEVEKLPFPTGAVAAEIAIALSGGEKERYRIFAIATMMAAIYESIRILFPSLTEIILGRRLMVINPIHYDFTEMIDPIIHGATTGITTNLLVIALGLIIPEIVIIWQFVTSIVSYVILPPIFISMGLKEYPYTPGRPMFIPGTLTGAWYEPQLFFWLSFAVGLLVAIGVIPTLLSAKQIVGAIKTFLQMPSDIARKSGVIPGKMAIMIFLASALTLAGLSYAFTPMGIPFLIGAILITTVFSFLNTIIGARSAGIIGGLFTIPYLNEVTIWLTTPVPGPQNPMSYWVWFNPFLAQPIGGASICIGYKAAQLTNTKPFSIAKAHILGTYMTWAVGLIIAGMLWYVYDVPSRFMPAPSYPADALLRALFITRQLGTIFKPEYIISSFIVGSIIGVIPRFLPYLSPFFGLPTLFGFVAGILDMPSNSTGIVLGLLLKKLMEKKLGKEWADKYVMTVAAGIFAGSSVVISLATALSFVRQAVAFEIY